jgi:hypothetical protein
LTHLDAEISVYGGPATVRVNMISGSISNPLSVVGSLVKLATNSGASELRIEGVLANERLANGLPKRYRAKSDGVVDTITISIGQGDLR